MKRGIYVRLIPAPCDCTPMLLTQCVTQPNSYQDSVRQDGSFHQKKQTTFLFSFSGVMMNKEEQIHKASTHNVMKY